MSSRDINKLHPALALRFRYLKDNWDYNDNELILVSTYRSKSKQAELWDLYQNHNGPKAAPPGQSLHNYGLAFDVAFLTEDGVADYSWPQFKELGRRGKKIGLTWGGDWPSADGPHFQFPMRWQEVAAGDKPPTLKTTFSLQLFQLKEALYKLSSLLKMR